MKLLKRPFEELTLHQDGATVKAKFLSGSEVAAINTELDSIYANSNFSYNCSSTYSLQGHIKVIPSATQRIFSINIPEKIIDAAKIIADAQGRLFDDYVCSSVEIWQELEHKELFWHTDNRKGMIRCFIYLEGGQTNSGAFQYMRGTHDRNYYVRHKLSKHQIDELSERIVVFDSPTGSMVIADTFGFHANKPRRQRRRVLMMEFQPRRCVSYPRSNIYLKSQDLSKKVIDHIGLFSHMPDPYRHGADYYFFKQNTQSDFDKFVATLMLKIFLALNYFGRAISMASRILRTNALPLNKQTE